MTCLIADIGGTNTRCAITRTDGDPVDLRVYTNRDFAGITELLRDYLETQPDAERPRHGLLAVAAPIRGEQVAMKNINWQFSSEDLCRALRFDHLGIVNDFEALAHAIARLNATQLEPIGNAVPALDKPRVVLGPGTGLGVASLIPVNGSWHAVSSEGGHMTMAASNPEEAELIERVRQKYGHCSAERLVSGPGLSYLYSMLSNSSERLTPERIAEMGAQGDATADRALEHFFCLFGTLAASVALTLGSFGGVYIGGGIIPRYAERFARSGFRERFEARGRYNDYLKAIPTYLITAEEPTLIGLAALVQERTTRSEC